MKKFRTYNQAKNDLKVFQDYISLIENYQPKNFTQRVIQEYAYQGNINRTAETLNRRGYKIDDRSIEPQDISTIIKSKPAPEDLLHKEIRKLYLKKTKSNQGSFSKIYR
ncbi:hypothetical protein [Lysinibacillus sp. fls2-241-R2A-57]|uniref:hypothetical protein n=1 Tax=Lysinibacillus sp. fls2-241-R2A-57 TaxID=3040292 RepID=UPI002553F2C6|nr:hypothetical protein [Lysinibacillus sp. fls2-241-R2A-57]